jgi:hypothetical protein
MRKTGNRRRARSIRGWVFECPFAGRIKRSFASMAAYALDGKWMSAHRRVSLIADGRFGRSVALQLAERQRDLKNEIDGVG